MIYNVIPINYFGGLGGQFLSSFIHAANNPHNNWIFSKDGNAHEIEKYQGIPPYDVGTDRDGSKNISFLINYSKSIPENIVTYPHGHYADPDLLMQYVNKQIKIYADRSQLNEIIGVFILKNPETTVDFHDLTVEQEKYKNHPMVRWRRYASLRFARLLNNCPDLEPRMLNISWNDMLYHDPEILITKLHGFTQLPMENFNREKFAEWRQLTHKTVDRLRQAGLA